MNFSKNDGDRLVIAEAIRTPFGQMSKSLAKFQSYELTEKLMDHIFETRGFKKDKIDGIVSGEISQSSKAPNVARVLAVKADLPIDSTAVSIANNCVSGYEAINEAGRRIILEENQVMLVTGQESMSNMPIYFNHAAWNAKTANSRKILKNWDSIKEEIELVDAVDEGLVDPIRGANMAETGEIAAQKLDITKEELDTYAHGSYKKAYDSLTKGEYDPYLVPVEHEKGTLDKDEYVMSKVSMVEKPERFAKANAIFDMPPHTNLKDFYKKYEKWIGKPYEEGKSKASVTLFNACPRTDGAAALIVTSESNAQKLDLDVQAYIKGWSNIGVDPIYMGLGMSHAMKKVLDVTGLSWDDIDIFEVHEAFAATAYGSLKLVKQEMGYDLLSRYEKGDINRNGGTLALGHPLGGTGLRVAINQIMALKQDEQAKYCMGTICAGGGVAGALILEKAA